MDFSTYWQIIGMLDWKYEGDDDKVLKPAVEYLFKLTDEEIFEFDEIMARLLYNIDSRALAHKLYADETKFSDDAFLYLRCVFIVNGPQLYNQVVRGQIGGVTSDMEFEAILYLPRTAWAKKHKQDESLYPHETKYCFESGSNEALWPKV